MWQQIILKGNDLDKLLESLDNLPSTNDVAVFASTAYPTLIVFSNKSFEKILRHVPLLKDYKPKDIPTPEIFDEISWKLLYGFHSF